MSLRVWSGSWSIRLRASESVCGLVVVLRLLRCPSLLSGRGWCRRGRRALSMGWEDEEGMVAMKVGGTQSDRVGGVEG